MMKKRHLVAIAALIVAITGTYGYFDYFGPQTVTQVNSGPDCRQGNVLDGVDRQARFTVLSTCETASGTVHDVPLKQNDGDIQFNLDVDPQYKHLLNDANNNGETKGMLVVEIIPKDQSSVYSPKEGDRIQVVGAWVTDNPHGWNEIHPAWKIILLQG